MILRFRNLRFAMSALQVVLFLAVVSVAAQQADDNSRKQPEAKAQTGERAMTAISTRPATSVNATKEERAASETAGRFMPASPAKPVAQSGSSDEWQFQFTPYLFLASLKGEVGARGLTTEVDAKFSDIIDELNFGFMSAFEARKNRFVFLTDLLYMNLSDSSGTPGPLFSSVKADSKTFILDPEAGYRVVESEGGSLDLLGGFRYWHLRNELDFRAGLLPARVVVQSKNWVDVVGGLRGRARLSERWFVTAKVDLGGGGSDFTYQLFGGAGVTIGKRGTLVFGYRYLDVNYDDEEGFRFDVAMKGPVIGLGLRF